MAFVRRNRGGCDDGSSISIGKGGESVITDEWDGSERDSAIQAVSGSDNSSGGGGKERGIWKEGTSKQVHGGQDRSAAVNEEDGSSSVVSLSVESKTNESETIDQGRAGGSRRSRCLHMGARSAWHRDVWIYTLQELLDRRKRTDSGCNRSACGCAIAGQGAGSVGDPPFTISRWVEPVFLNKLAHAGSAASLSRAAAGGSAAIRAEKKREKQKRKMQKKGVLMLTDGKAGDGGL